MRKVMTSVLIVVFSLGITEVSAGDIEVKNAWIRLALSGARVTAGFADLVNHGVQKDALIEVRAPFARFVSLHDSRVEGDMVVMEPQEQIELPVGKQVRLAPGGLHIMFRQLDRGVLEEGREVGLVFRFRDAGEVSVRAVVKGLGEMTHHRMKH